MLTVPDNRSEDNPAAGDEHTTTLAGEGVGNVGPDEEPAEPPTLDTLAREGARRMLMTAMEAEVAEYIERFGDTRDADGRRLVVRNGQAQERTVTCGAGTWRVRAPRVNDKRVDGDGGRERFTSRILPPYMRRSPQVSEVLPLLYLRGLSTGDFREALPALLGKDAAGLSPTTISRLTAAWDEEYEAFQRRDLSDCDYVYVWVDGIHFNIRLEEDRLCTLVVIGVRADGIKELVALEDGYRESQESWASVLRDLRGRGLRAPAVAIGDGALGFWSALRDVWPETTVQRDWCHKLANVLDKLPKRLRPRAKRALRDIMYAPVKIDAERGIDAFVAEFEAKYPKAAACLAEDREALLAFFGFPAEHWLHLRTSNVIESVFATVRLRQRVTKGAGSRTKGLLMAYKLVAMAQRRWRRLNGAHLLPLVRAGVAFVDGVIQISSQTEDRKEAA